MTRFTAREDDFLKKHHGAMTLKEIAEQLGRSVSGVQGRATKLGLVDIARREREDISANKGEFLKSSATDDALERLTDLVETLKAALHVASSSMLPQIAREYRSTIQVIHEIKAARGDDDEKESELDALFTEFGATARKSDP